MSGQMGLLKLILCRFIKPILILVYSFWIPQIVHCARTDVRQPLKPLYIVGMSLTRLLLPLYLFGCPSNVLRIPPSPAFCILLVSWLSAQVISNPTVLFLYPDAKVFVLSLFLFIPNPIIFVL